MKLFFENSQRMRRLIGEPTSIEAALEIIHAFCEDHNFYIHYIRNWIDEGELVYDVGSWNEFFYLTSDDGAPLTLEGM